MCDPFSDEAIAAKRRELALKDSEGLRASQAAASEKEEALCSLKMLVQQFLERAQELGVAPNARYRYVQKEWYDRRVGLLGTRTVRECHESQLWIVGGYHCLDKQASGGNSSSWYNILENGLVLRDQLDHSGGSTDHSSWGIGLGHPTEGLRRVMLEILAAPDVLTRSSVNRVIEVDRYNPEYLL